MVNKDIQDNLILELNKYCYFCDIKEPIIIHHIIRKKDGGLEQHENLITLCPNCHSRIHEYNYYLSYSKGYYYMLHRLNKEVRVFPSNRQMCLPREPPLNSISKSIQIERLYIEEEMGLSP